MKGPFIALVLGVAAYLVTQEVIIGVLVAAISFWFLRRRQRNEYAAPNPPLDLPEYSPRRNAREGVIVVCKLVTPERQEWASVKTGRLYDVLSPDGPANARPGDHAQLVVSGTRYLVRNPNEPER